MAGRVVFRVTLITPRARRGGGQSWFLVVAVTRRVVFTFRTVFSGLMVSQPRTMVRLKIPRQFLKLPSR